MFGRTSERFACESNFLGAFVEKRYTQLRIGLLGLGLHVYWAQFSNLQQRLEGYIEVVAQRLAGSKDRVVVNLGLIDTYDKALAAGHTCRAQDVDILVVYATTYALSSIILPVILRAKVPILLLNLQPTAALPYEEVNALGDRVAMTAEWLAYCGGCPVPEIANVLKRLDIGFHQVTGILENDPATWHEMEAWMQAAQAAKALSHSRLGLMGQYYSGMLDVSTDLAQVSGHFGIHVEMLEVDELNSVRSEVACDRIETELTRFQQFFVVDALASEEELMRAARTSVALTEVVRHHQLDMLAYYGRGTAGSASEDTFSSMILGSSLLTGHGVPVAGEYEVKNVIAMKILDLLDAGGSFAEYYAMDFNEDVVLLGHDGPGHAAIAQEKTRVRPLRIYHGKAGRGLSVEMAVKYGPVTLLSVVEDRQRGFRLLVAEGESVSGPILEIGNTNSRYRFSIGARRFTEEWNAAGPAHHCAIGVGHCAGTLRKFAWLLSLPCTQVC